MDHQKHHHGVHTSTATACRPRRRTSSWARCLCELDATCIVVIIVLGLTTAAATKRAPVLRPIFTGDATIAYPHTTNSIPFWVAICVPVVLLLCCVGALEFVVLRRHQCWRQGLLNSTNVLLALLATLAVVGALTEVFKRLCGRLRPDFLARCQPSGPGAASPVAYGTTPAVECRAPWSSELADGHMSFPSGHSSCSMAAGLFAALYLLWGLHWRVGHDLLSPAAALSSGSGSSRWSWRVWLGQEAAKLGVTLLVLFQLAWPWGVAVSRFRDNRHNASDIVGGLLLGACFAPLFVARLVSHFAAWADVRAREEQQQEQQHSAAPSPSAVLPIVAPGHVSSSASSGNGVTGGARVAMVSLH